MRARFLVALAVGLVAVLATPAAASDHLMIVNEVQLSEGGDATKQFVELIDPVDEPFPSPTYGLAKFDAAGGAFAFQGFPVATFSSRDNTQPFLVATDTSSAAGIRDEALGLDLPLTAGQICFYRNNNGTVAANRIHCLRYGTITNPVASGASNQGATPGTGLSLQVCGSGTVVAAPTPKAPNRCSAGGGGGGGGGGADDKRKPKATLGGKKTQDVDKLAVTATMDEDGTVSATATVRVPNSSKVYRFKKATKSAKSGKKVKLRLKLSKKAKAAVKRALASGRKLKAKVKVTAADKAKNKTTKKRSIKLKS